MFGKLANIKSYKFPSKSITKKNILRYKIFGKIFSIINVNFTLINLEYFLNYNPQELSTHKYFPNLCFLIMFAFGNKIFNVSSDKFEIWNPTQLDSKLKMVVIKNNTNQNTNNCSKVNAKQFLKIIIVIFSKISSN